MSTKEKDGLMDCLFSRQGMKLLNLKFFRGSNDLISEEEFKDQICKAENRKRTSVKAGAFPKCKKGPVNLARYVAEL
jgi:hypothetical protein